MRNHNYMVRKQRKKKDKKKVWISFFLSLSFMLFSLIPTGYGSLQQSGEAIKEYLQVGYDPWIGYAPVFIAQEKGFFQEHGITVKLIPFSGPGDTLTALIAGHLDVGLTTANNGILLHDKGASIVNVFFTDSSNGADAIVARKEITSLKDLKGKRIAATLGEVNHFLLLLALERAGLKEAEVEIVNMNADDAGAAFIAGSLDAVVTWEPWVSKAVSEGNGRIIFSSHDVPNAILDTVAVSKKTLMERPEDISRFLTSMDQGVQYLHKNPEVSVQIVAKWLNVQPAEVVDMLKGVKVFDFRDNQELFGLPQKPGPAYTALEKVADFLLKQQVIKHQVNISTLLEGKFVQSQ